MLWDFTKEEHEGPKLQLMKSRVVIALIPSRWLCVEGDNKEEPYPYRILGIDVWIRRIQSSLTHELAIF
jgi:hypothetical protein